MTAAEDLLAQALAALAGYRDVHEAKSTELTRVRSAVDLDPVEDPATAIVRSAERVLQLATEVEVAGNAITAAEDQVDEARRGVLRERAADLRTRAGRLRDAAAGWQARVDELLDQIEQVEGCRYVSPSIVAQFAAVGGPRSWETPRSEMAIRGATALEKSASDLEGMAASANRPQLETHVRRPLRELLPIEAYLATTAVVAA